MTTAPRSPHFTPFPDALWEAVEVMWQGHEPLTDFLPQVPVRTGLATEYRDCLDTRIATLEPKWSRLGVQTPGDAITAVVLRFTQGKNV